MFISYAQNFEDVILWRALKHIQKGFYVDVGAMDPTIESVTKTFYDVGWIGINIEPVQEWFEKLIKERPNDINLPVVISNKDDTIEFFEIMETGLSSIYEESLNEIVGQRGYHVSTKHKPSRTLNSILKEYQIQNIHFLKIDVEGAEKKVLEGLDLEKYRPWIIIIESTIPNSQEENYSIWEYLLLENSYNFVYFDGLNRFYVAKEHDELTDKLTTPPNYFDFFKTWHEFCVEKELENKLIDLKGAQEKAEKLLSEKHQLQSDLKGTQECYEKLVLENHQVWVELDKVYHSKSFLITKPIREFSLLFKEIPKKFSNFKRILKTRIFLIIHFIRKLPIISPLADKLKVSNHSKWVKIREKFIKEPDNHQTSKVTEYNISQSESFDREDYYLNLILQAMNVVSNKEGEIK